MWRRKSAIEEPPKIISPPQVYVAKKNGTAERAVFAHRRFEAGEIIELCPILIIEEPVDELSEQLRAIAFNWEVLANTFPSSAIALGLGSVYNHADLPNLCYDAADDRSVLVFTAAHAIEKDQELTIDYRKPGGRFILERNIRSQ